MIHDARSDKRFQGYTLMEVLVALTILSVAALAVVHLVQANTTELAKVKFSETAAMLAGKTLQDLLEEQKPSPTLRDDGDFDEYPSYAWKARVQATGQDNIYVLVVTVTPPDGKQAVAYHLFKE